MMLPGKTIFPATDAVALQTVLVHVIPHQLPQVAVLDPFEDEIRGDVALHPLDACPVREPGLHAGKQFDELAGGIGLVIPFPPPFLELGLPSQLKVFHKGQAFLEIEIPWQENNEN